MKKPSPTAPIALKVRLGLLGIGVGILGIALLLRPSPPTAKEQAAAGDSQDATASVEETVLHYDRLLQDQVVEVEVSGPRVQTEDLFLWTGKAWKRGKELEAVQAQILLSGAEITSLQTRKNRFYLRLGPFASVSDRNNMRLEMVKQNIQVLSYPPVELTQ